MFTVVKMQPYNLRDVAGEAVLKLDKLSAKFEVFEALVHGVTEAAQAGAAIRTVSVPEDIVTPIERHCKERS